MNALTLATERARATFERGRAYGEKAPTNRVAASLFGTNDGLNSVMPNQNVHEEQYRHAKKGWPHAAIRPIANRFAALMLRVARTTARGAEPTRSMKDWQRASLPPYIKHIVGDLVLLDSHPLLESVSRPNPLQVQWQLAAWTAESLEATGKAYWWFSRADDGRIRIWPIPASWVEPSGGGLRADWKISPSGLGGRSEPVPANEIAYFNFPDGANPLFGSTSPLSANARSIMNSDAIHESQYQGFRGGHMPSWAFILGEKALPDGTKERPTLTKEQREELDARMRQLFYGPHKHGRHIILDGLISDAKRLTLAPTEMDYLNSTRIVEREIMKGIGVNPIITGEVENANRASATIADENFARNVVNPMATLIGQVLTVFVAESPLFSGSERVVAFYEGAEAGDPELEAKNFQWAYDRAIIDDNDIRTRLLKLPPKENGNVARIPLNLVETPVERPTQSGSRAPRRRGFNKSAYRDIWLKQHGLREKDYAGDLTLMFRRQAASVRERLLDSGATAQADDLFRPEDWDEELLTISRLHLGRAMVSGRAVEEAVFKQADFRTKQGYEFLHDIDGQSVQTAIESYTTELFRQPYWQDINKHVRDDIEFILDTGLRDGQSIEQMARRITDKLDEGAFNRAMRIARSEVTGAVNSAAHAVRGALARNGLVSGSEWASIIDEASRGADPDDIANHVVMDGEVVGTGEMFDVQGFRTPFPGHYSLPAHQRVNCRCLTTAVTVFDEPSDDSGLLLPEILVANYRRLNNGCAHKP